MDPEKVRAIRAAIQGYQDMTEESRRLRPDYTGIPEALRQFRPEDHAAADKVLSGAWDEYWRTLLAAGFNETVSGAWDEYWRTLLAAGFNETVIEDLFNRVVVGAANPDKGVEKRLGEWLCSLKPMGTAH
jgi:hypothetical protein